MAAKSLRAVARDEVAPPKRRLSITEAADAGTQRELLVAMRARVARAVDDPNCPPRDLAALTRRLKELAADIEAIDVKAQQEAREDAQLADDQWDAEAL